jgi:DNA repair exonuclease SbcCD ATPase subunit
LNTIKLWTDNLSCKIKELNDNTAEKNLSIAKLETQLNSLTEYNASNQEHSTFIDLTSLQSNIEKCNEKIKSFNNVKANLSNDIIKANSEIISIENKKKNAESLIIVINNALKKITELKEENQRLSSQPLELKETVKIDDVYAKIAEYDTKILELSNKISLGNDKLNSLVNHPDICPTCKQPWHIDNLDYKITVLKEGINKLNSELENLKTLKQNEQTRIIENNRIIDSNNKIMNIKNTILMNENKILELKEGLKANFEKLSEFEYTLENNLITSIRLKKDDTESLKINIAAMHGNIADLDLQIQNVQNEMSEFNQKIGIAKINNEIYNTIIYNNEKIKNLNTDLDSLKADILEQKTVIDELSKFNTKILSDKGLLVASLLQRVSEYLNTDELLQVETVHTMQNGSLKPTLNIKLFVKEYNKYVDYTMLSGGQRLQADLRFLKGITNSLGSVSVLFMDETFKYFSSDAVYIGIDIINDMKVDKVFLIIHGMNNEQLSDNNILVTLSDKGSKYTKV